MMQLMPSWKQFLSIEWGKCLPKTWHRVRKYTCFNKNKPTNTKLSQKTAMVFFCFLPLCPELPKFFPLMAIQRLLPYAQWKTQGLERHPHDIGCVPGKLPLVPEGEILLMEEIRLTTWDVWNLVDSGKNYQPQLVQDFFHQQYVDGCDLRWFPCSTPCLIMFDLIL